MNVSRFINLAAIFSLDLESQFMKDPVAEMRVYLNSWLRLLNLHLAAKLLGINQVHGRIGP